MFQKSILTLCMLSCCLMNSPFARAQEEAEVTLEPVVVTATRVEMPEKKVGKSVVVITSEDLEQRKPTSLTNALRDLAGIRAQELRGPGSQATINIRGVGARYTQILINGLPVRDASDAQGSALEFMNDILIEDIERIEIVRGPSSTLYGSDSIGGTINIITKKGTEIPELFASFEGGSLSTFQEVVGARGARGPVHGSLTFKRLDSDGIDAHDNYEDTALAGQVGVDLSDTMAMAFSAKYSDSELDVNSSPAIENGEIINDRDNADDTKEKTLFNGAFTFTHDVSESLDYNVKLGYVDTERIYYTGPEDDYGYENTAEYQANTLNTEIQMNYALSDTHLLTGGYEYEGESYELDLELYTDEPDATRHSFYIQDSIVLLDDTLDLVPGIRYANHDQADSHVDWELSSSYLMNETFRLHGHVGTGFRAPALYELYGAYFSSYTGEVVVIGNEDLDPEESLGWDAGMEVSAFETLSCDLTYFSIDFDEMITYGTLGYENTDGGKSQGLELKVSYTPFPSLSLNGSYTYTQAEEADGEDVAGISEHQFGLNVNWRALERLNANLSMTAISDRDTMVYDSSTYESVRCNEDGYVVVDLAANYMISDHFDIWGRINNLFDEEYTENFYRAPGFGAYAGVKLAL